MTIKGISFSSGIYFLLAIFTILFLPFVAPEPEIHLVQNILRYSDAIFPFFIITALLVRGIYVVANKDWLFMRQSINQYIQLFAKPVVMYMAIYLLIAFCGDVVVEYAKNNIENSIALAISGLVGFACIKSIVISPISYSWEKSLGSSGIKKTKQKEC